MDTVVSRLLVDIGCDLSDLKKGFGEAGGAIDGFTGKASSAASKLGTLFTGAAIAGVAGLAAGLGVATKSAMDFEKTLSGVQAVSGASIAQMKELSDLALKLGADTSFSATEAAQGIEELVKAGVSMADVMGGAAKASLDLAAAGGISVADAATIASNAMNQFGIKGKDMAGVADLIAGAANASAIDVGQFKFSLQSVGAVAATVGMSFKDTATAIAVLGQAGITGSDAGTSLKTMLMGLQPQTKEQTKLFRELGLMTKDGKNQFFDATGKLKDFATVSQILQDALKDQTEQQRVATLQTLFGSDAIRAAAVFTKQGAGGFRDMAKAMGEVSAAEVAEARLNNLSGSIEKLTGSLSTVAITIGMGLTPALKQLVDWATSVINYWMPTISMFASKLPAAIDSATGSIRTFMGWLAISTAALLGIEPADYTDPWEALRDAISYVWGEFQTRLVPALKWLTETGWPLLTGAMGAVSSYVTNVFIPVLKASWDWLAPKFQAALTWMISTGWPALTNAISSFGSWVQSSGIPMLRSVWDWLANKVGSALTWLRDTGWPRLREAASTVATWFLSTGVPMLQSVWNWLSPKIGAALTWLTTTGWPLLTGAMTTAWSWVTTSLLPTLSSLWSWLSPKVGAALSWLTDTGWPLFKAAGATVWTWLTTSLIPTLSEWYVWLQDRLSPVYTWFITYAWPSLQSAGASVVEWVKTSLLPTLSEWYVWLQDRLSPIYSWFITHAWPKLLEEGGKFWTWLTTSLIPQLSEWWWWLEEKTKPVTEWWIETGYPGLEKGAKEVARWGAALIQTWKDFQLELAKTDFAESWVTIFDNISRFGEYIVNNLDLGGWFASVGEGATKGTGPLAYFAEMLAWISRKLASLSALLPGGKAPPDIGAPPKAPSGSGGGGSSWTGGGVAAPPARSGGGGGTGGGSGGGGGGSIINPNPFPGGGGSVPGPGKYPDVGVMREWGQLIGLAENSRGVPGAIIAGIMDIESSGNANAQSPMNRDKNGRPIGRAQGLMQVMPFHFPGVTLGPDGEASAADRAKMQDPLTNILKGAEILAAEYKSFGTWQKAAAAYFGAIDRKTGEITGGTDVTGTSGNQYVRKFMDAAKMYGWTGFADGGWITEPIVGRGLRSGRGYTFGEHEAEYVTPRSGMGGGGGTTININIAIQGNALATKEQIADAVVVGLRQAQVTGRTKVTVV